MHVNLLFKWPQILHGIRQCAVWTVRLDLFVWLGVGVHWDPRLKTARKSIHLVDHSWINHRLRLRPINSCSAARCRSWTFGETQLTGSLFNTEAATVVTSSVGSPRQYLRVSASSQIQRRSMLVLFRGWGSRKAWHPTPNKRTNALT